MALLALAALVGPAAVVAWAHTPYATGRAEPVVQPIKFDHRHHVRDNGIDCLYCHFEATRSRNAGVPPTSVCMGCHAQIWTDSPELEAVRQSAFTGEPIAWRRVHAMPAFVRFDHRVHVSKGVGCVSCHDRVDQMPETFAVHDLTMSWCLGCHRDPAPHLRPLEAITDMTLHASGTPRALGEELRRTLDVDPRTDCTTCHQ